MFKNLFRELSSLDTLEKKSFWIVSSLVMAVGFYAIAGSSRSYNLTLVAISVIVGIGAPLLMMIICVRTKKYHVCYPILCMLIGGISVPTGFLANGGFDSGMPIFCSIATVISAFCYDKKWRHISCLVSAVCTLTALMLAKGGIEPTTPVSTSWVENDIITNYVLGTLGLYVCINLVLNEARNYVTGAELLSTFVDRRVQQELIEQADQGTLNMEGVRKRVTVLFADISRFTSITEKMEPEVAAHYLNTFLSVSDECVHKNGGIVDKFIGDCVMAYWPDTDKEEGSGILPAVRTVLDIRQNLYALAPSIYAECGYEMDFSAGLEYGDVVHGSIGSSLRKDYTIIGDTVNTANRIQGLASHGELLVSDNVANRMKDRLMLTAATETLFLRGKSKPMTLYRVDGILEQEGKAAAPLRIRTAKNEAPEQQLGGYTLFICGCRGSYPVSGIRYSEFGGETSCYILKKDDYAVVIDCGTGLNNAQDILSDCRQIDILLTHVHYDHIIGLMNGSAFPRGVPLRILGNFDCWGGSDTIRNFLEAPYWPVNLFDIPLTDVQVGTEYPLEQNIRATFYQADHPNDGCVIMLMAGNNKLCVFSDLEDPRYISPAVARNSNILLYDGMFDSLDIDKHRGWGHSTWQDGVAYAVQENVKRLVITHHNPDNSDLTLRKLEAEAKEEFAQTVFARAGDRFQL